MTRLNLPQSFPEVLVTEIFNAHMAVFIKYTTIFNQNLYNCLVGNPKLLPEADNPAFIPSYLHTYQRGHKEFSLIVTTLPSMTTIYPDTHYAMSS